MHSLANLTVVITGASSGLGRATALAFARRGARLALAARREGVLRQVAEECEALGGRAVAVPTDVTDPEAVGRLARTAADTYGSIGVWVNNAGVGAFGRFTDTPVAVHRRVIETDLLGYLYGAHAVLPYFLAERHGVLINIVSVGAWVAAPFAVAYSAGKFGLRGFSQSLRNELTDWPDIHVCDIFPEFMDTPGVQHGANYTRRRLKPAPPLYDPHKAAEIVVGLAVRPRRTVPIGMAAQAARITGGLAPRLTGWVMARGTELYLRRAAAAPVTEGNLFVPLPEGTTARGGWRTRSRPWLAIGLAAAGLVAAAVLTPRRLYRPPSSG